MTYYLNYTSTSVVKVSTNVSIEWLDVLIVVSSANMSAQVLVSERGRSFTCFECILKRYQAFYKRSEDNKGLECQIE